MKLLAARGVTKLLRGEVSDAESDLEEAITQGGAGDEEALEALGLGGRNEESVDTYVFLLVLFARPSFHKT